MVGTVGFLGDINGLIYLYFDEGAGVRERGHPARNDRGGTGRRAATDAVNDAIGEITNMVVGGFKNSFCDAGYPCKLTIPSILRGRNFCIEPISSAQRHIYHFDCDGHRVVADILMKAGGLEPGSETMRHKILTVDDSKTVRIIVRKAFKNFDCEILEAANGVEGLAAASKDTPDLDPPRRHHAGDGRGRDADEAQVGSPRSRAIPVMMLTAEGGRDQVLKIAKIGVRDYIVKPFKEDTLLEKAGRIIDLKPLSDGGGQGALDRGLPGHSRRRGQAGDHPADPGRAEAPALEDPWRGHARRGDRISARGRRPT